MFIFLSYKFIFKRPLKKSMASKKRLTTGEGTTSKGKSVATTGGIIFPSGLSPNPIVEETVSALSQGGVGDITRHQLMKPNSSK